MAFQANVTPSIPTRPRKKARYAEDVCTVERVFLNLQRLSRGLQRWSQRKVGNVKMQLEMTKEVLHCLEIAKDSRNLDLGEEWLRKKLKVHCIGLASLE
jgi:hypothetical protein